LHIRHERRLVNGINLHCAVAGEGPLVLLLHGFPEFWYSWRHQIPELAKHFTVVAPDMRGYNESDKPPQVNDYVISTLVEDVVQLIHSFGYERAVVVGHDWGAAIAWQVALTHPEMVEKLGILNVPHPRLFIQNLLTNPRQMLRSWYIAFFQVPWLPEQVIKVGNYRFIDQAFRGMAVHKQQFTNEDIAQYKAAIAKPRAVTSAVNYYRAAARQGLLGITGSASLVTMPTLVIWGEQDTALGKELNIGLERYVP
jgi:pimeloyl-ACP methyl ester carboxylesterase